VKDTLETMGASILLGGATTFVGVIPLAFSTTTVFMVVFKSFLAMVCLGCGVGLILLPVLLSLAGPVTTTHDEVREGATVGSMLGGKDSFQIADHGETREDDSFSEEELEGGSTDERSSRTNLALSLADPVATTQNEGRDGATVGSMLGRKDSIQISDRGETREVDSSSGEELEGGSNDEHSSGEDELEVGSTDERSRRTNVAMPTPRGTVECSIVIDC
jgi:Patched family